LQVDGWFTKNSAGKNSIQGTQNVRSVPQYGRILPICAKDTPHFWSDVYKVGTRGGNLQADVPQYGRSMIEMLGVLVIIGVLSVGGIAGYTKAMRMYNSNQQRRQISELVLASVEVLPNLYYYKGDKDRITLAETFDALGYVPEGITLGSGWFKDKSGNLIYPYYEVKSKSYSLMINIQQKKAEEAEDYCLNIFSVGQQYADFVSSVELHDTVSENDSGVSQSGLIFRASGNKNCSKYGGENCVKDLTPVKIKQICNLCEEKDNCRVHIFL
jgi:hypothetical protein